MNIARRKIKILIEGRCRSCNTAGEPAPVQSALGKEMICGRCHAKYVRNIAWDHFESVADFVALGAGVSFSIVTMSAAWFIVSVVLIIILHRFLYPLTYKVVS
jgi:hypothetical protein